MGNIQIRLVSGFVSVIEIGPKSLDMWKPSSLKHIFQTRPWTSECRTVVCTNVGCHKCTVFFVHSRTYWTKALLNQLWPVESHHFGWAISHRVDSKHIFSSYFNNDANSPSLACGACVLEEVWREWERKGERACALHAEKGKVGCSTFNLHAVSLVPGLSQERERQCTAVSHRGITPQGECLPSLLFIYFLSQSNYAFMSIGEKRNVIFSNI